jgi:hypothetical protein
VGRLENIIERNQSANRPRERIVVSLVFGGIILLVLALMVFTDLGTPPTPPDAPRTVTPAGPRDKRADGILLRKAPSRPAAATPVPVAPTSTPKP